MSIGVPNSCIYHLHNPDIFIFAIKYHTTFCISYSRPMRFRTSLSGLISNCKDLMKPDPYGLSSGLDNLVINLKELRDRASAGDTDAIEEFFGVYTFEDGKEYSPPSLIRREELEQKMEFPRKYLGTINGNGEILVTPESDESFVGSHKPFVGKLADSGHHVWTVYIEWGSSSHPVSILADYKGRGFSVFNAETGQQISGPIRQNWRDPRIVAAVVAGVLGALSKTVENEA